MIYLYFIYFNILTNQKNIVMVYNKNDINVLKNISLSHRYIIVHVKWQNQPKKSSINFQLIFKANSMTDDYQMNAKNFQKFISNILKICQTS